MTTPCIIIVLKNLKQWDMAGQFRNSALPGENSEQMNQTFSEACALCNSSVSLLQLDFFSLTTFSSPYCTTEQPTQPLQLLLALLSLAKNQ